MTATQRSTIPPHVALPLIQHRLANLNKTRGLAIVDGILLGALIDLTEVVAQLAEAMDGRTT